MQEDNLNTEENILQQNYQINVPINNVYPTIQDPPKYSPPPQGYQVYQPPNNQMVGQMIQSQQVNQNQQNVATRHRKLQFLVRFSSSMCQATIDERNPTAGPAYRA